MKIFGVEFFSLNPGTWENQRVNIRNEEGNFYTEGKYLESKTQEFDVDKHRPTGAYFSSQSSVRLFASEAFYCIAQPYLTIAHSANHVAFCLKDFGKALKHVYYDKTQKISDAVKPVFQRLKDNFPVMVIGAGIPVLWITGAEFWSYNLYNTLWYGYVLSNALFITNPKDMRLKIAKVEHYLFPNRLDGVNSLSSDVLTKDFMLKFLNGKYTLSYFLDIHQLGTERDMTRGEKRFEKVETE